MASEAANQKRKRGRPSNASRDDQGASQTQLTFTRDGEMASSRQDGDAADLEETARPQKRGKMGDTNSSTEVRRKRGRPSLSKRPEEEAVHDDAQATGSNSGRRGRPAAPKQPTRKTTDGGEDVEVVEGAPKKRGRPPRDTQVNKKRQDVAEEADDENEGDSSLLRRSGRDRRSVGEWFKGAPEGHSNEAEPNESNNSTLQETTDTALSLLLNSTAGGDSSIARRRRSDRDNRSVGESHKDAQEQDPTAESSKENTRPTKTKKAGRPSLAEASAASSKQAPATQPNPKKRGRPSLNQETASGQTKETRPGPKKRGRPSLSGKDPLASRKHRIPEPKDVAADEAGPSEAPRRRGRPRTSDVSTTSPRQAHRRTSHTQQRARSASPDSGSSPPPYRHLKTQTRNIARHIIDEKWSSLDAASIANVTSLLHSASRPVLLRLNNLQKHTHATTAINVVSNRLRNKLARGLPFPPATTATKREDEMQFERTVDGIRNLEAQLNPLLHGVELLKREKEKAERELERDYKTLTELSNNARAEGRERRDRLRKNHVLVPDIKADGDREGDLHEIGELLPAQTKSGNAFAALEDGELKVLAGQIGRNMESMRGNLQQIDGISPAIAESRAALKMALLPHLDQKEFEQVILG